MKVGLTCAELEWVASNDSGHGNGGYSEMVSVLGYDVCAVARLWGSAERP